MFSLFINCSLILFSIISQLAIRLCTINLIKNNTCLLFIKLQIIKLSNYLKKVAKIDILETIYNHVLKIVFGIANPIKKSIIKTQCKVHKSINIDALKILRNDKYLAEYNFFSSYILDMNEGTVWADQDFKSSNHLYNPYKKRGLYGRKSAMDLAIEYYSKAINLWEKGQQKSLFYLGAALHIIKI